MMISSILDRIDNGVVGSDSRVFSLNPDLEEESRGGKMSFQRLANAVAGKMDVRPIGMVGTTLDDGIELQESLMYGLSRAYNLHQSISLAPHDLWYVVLTEIAREVNANPSLYRSIFTKGESKMDILVEAPTGEIPIDVVISRLSELVPVDLDLFIPEFSTYDRMSLAAAMAAFADAVKSFYSYSTYCCGIREIELRGSLYDWSLISSHAGELKKVFVGTVLEGYLERVRSRSLALFRAALNGHGDFFNSIFTSTGVGSGGQLEIDGWFASDFFVQGGGHMIENYPSTWSLVPFKCVSYGRSFSDAYGAFYNTVERGFRVQGYGRITMEVPVNG